MMRNKLERLPMLDIPIKDQVVFRPQVRRLFGLKKAAQNKAFVSERDILVYSFQRLRKRVKDEPTQDEIRSRAREIREDGYFLKEEEVWIEPWTETMERSRRFGTDDPLEVTHVNDMLDINSGSRSHRQVIRMTDDMRRFSAHGNREADFGKIGNQCVSAKLTEAQALEIFDNKEGLSRIKLAEKYGVSRSAIDAITSKRTWRYLTAETA